MGTSVTDAIEGDDWTGVVAAMDGIETLGGADVGSNGLTAVCVGEAVAGWLGGGSSASSCGEIAMTAPVSVAAAVKNAATYVAFSPGDLFDHHVPERSLLFRPDS